MIRLILLLILFLLSLLSIFQAPTHRLWLMSILVTEYALGFICFTGLVLLSGFWLTKYRMPTTFIGLAALLLFLSTPIRAILVAKKINDDMQLEGPDSKTGSTPLSFMSLFIPWSLTTPKVAFDELTYNVFDDGELKMKFYESQMPGRKPCVVVIHGIQ